MAQSFTQQVSVAMSKGLVTESSPLVFPEDASLDELNCSLLRSGVRRRRLALRVDDGDPVAITATPSSVYSVHRWDAVGGDVNRDYAVVQVDNILHFFLLTNDTYTTADKVSYTVNLSNYLITTPAPDPWDIRVTCTSIKGSLVVTATNLQSFYITRRSTTGTHTVNIIDFYIRDFEWLGQTNNYYQDITTPSAVRRYDTLNTGWFHYEDSEGARVDNQKIIALASGSKVLYNVAKDNAKPLKDYITSQSKWPRLTHPWYSGKNSSGAFSAEEFNKVDSGGSLNINGRFILNLADMDREAISGVSDIPVPDALRAETNRFSTCTAYAGRVFFSGLFSQRSSNRIYFSQQLQDMGQVGNFYQKNDPTAEYLSDLLDTDGGYVTIQEAKNIRALATYGAKLLAFADNGVWAVSGVDDVFRATDFRVEHISEFGIMTVDSLVLGSSAPYWWSEVGIHTISTGENLVTNAQSLTTSSIQTFWDNIPLESKRRISAGYDKLNGRVFWMYSDGTSPLGYLNSILILDEQIGAFYPWKVSSTTDTPWMVGAINVSAGTTDENSMDTIKIVCATSSGSLQFATFTDTSFKDWGTESYSSYAVTGYRFKGDLTLMKNSPYITLLMESTEEGWTANDDGTYSIRRPSGVLVSVFWDFKLMSSTKPQQGYLLKRPPIPSEGSVQTYQFDQKAITTRLKTRGRGRVMSIKFESEEGKDFCIYGFETVDARNTQP